MRKIITLLLSLCFTLSCVYAESITKTLNSLNVNKSAVSVSVKEINTGNIIYSLNDRAPMHPASTLKLVTSSASYDALGQDFNFVTGLYKSTNNDLYLKLSGDPFLKSSDLEYLMSEAKAKNIIEPKNFYLDDTLFDNVEWGEGWQWDDDLNPSMPKFSIYNLDKNLLKIEISPTSNNMPADIIVKPFYPITFMNLVNTDRKAKNNGISIEKNSSIASNILNISGTVAKTSVLFIPVNDTKRYFTLRLEDALRDKKIEYYKSIKSAKLPTDNIYLVAEVKHEISYAMSDILKNSNNLTAETLFKTAGAKWTNSAGSAENSVKMLNDYLTKTGIYIDDIKVVDGSGVSKNNILTADFMTDFLVYKSKDENFENFKALLPSPGEGTLKNRMLYFKEALRAKTGTLSDSSAIAGYITSRKGKTYVFDIMINDAKTSPADKKNIEEQILRCVYMNY